MERGSIWSALGGASLTLLGASAVHADVRTLAELERIAVTARPEIASARADARAQGAEFDQAKSEFMPHFALRGEVAVAPGGRVIQLPSESTGGTTKYFVSGSPALGGGVGKALQPVPRATLELSGTASVYDFGRSSSASEAARRGRKAGEAAQHASTAELLSLVRLRYLGWLAAYELATFASTNAADAGARREEVERLVNEGERPRAELSMARSAELLVLLEKQRADTDAESARLTLAEAAGADLKRDDTPDLSLLDPDARVPNRTEADIANHAALQLKEDAKRAAAVAASRSSRPDLRVGASVGVRAQQSIKDDNGTPTTSIAAFPLYNASLGIVVPLWDGGSSAAGSAKARAEADSARAERERVRLMQLREHAQAEVDYSAADTRAATASELVALSKARVEDLEGGFQLGAATLDQISDARSTLRRAETEALLAKIDRAAARMRMSDKPSPVAEIAPNGAPAADAAPNAAAAVISPPPAASAP